MVSLQLTARRDSAALVRSVVDGLADMLTLDPMVIDDVKTAVSEACNNVVEHAYTDHAGKLVVSIAVVENRLEITVRDWGGGFTGIGGPGEHMRVGLPLINALAERAEFSTVPNEGTEVRMTFAFPGEAETPHPVLDLSGASELEAWAEHLRGDVVLTLPVELLARVLGRLARTLAAGARFSLERFSDLYLISDALATYARDLAGSAAVSLALSAERNRLTVAIGPVRPESGGRRATGARNPLEGLADELALEPVAGEHVLRVVVVDRPGEQAADRPL